MWLPPVIALWPFASAGMLIWGLAAAAPILIHLWNKRRYNEVAWAAMEYLLAAARKNARRIRIEQFLLLLVRVLIPLLMALALADPIFSLFPGRFGAVRGGGQKHLVLVLDSSYSMAYRPSEKSRFEIAKELASQLVEQTTQGDGVTLVLMADPPQAVIGAPAFDPADVIEEIESLRLPHAGAKLSATLAELEAVLQRAAEQHPRLTQHAVCFFTDLGRNTWDEVATDQCRAQLGRLAEKAELTLVDLGSADAENAAVVRLDVNNGLITAGSDVAFEAEVRQFGGPRPLERRIAFFVDGRRVHEEEVEASEDGRATASFLHRFQAPGEHQVEVRLSPDALELDDHRWLSVPVRESVRVLCVGGKYGAARYAALALQPDRSERPRIRPEVRSENALLESDLSDYDCVVVCNVGRFGGDEAAALLDYLKSGGGLIVFLGDQVQAENYNQALGGELSEKRVLPARIDSVVTGGQYHLDPREYRHPVTAAFRGHEGSGLLSTPVWTYWKLTPYDAEAAKVALAFQNGDPAIVDEQILRGRCFLVATAASPLSVDRSANGPAPWTALAYWHSFVPLLHEMLALAVRSRFAGRNLQVGDRLEGSLPSSIANVPLTVVEPEGRGTRVRVTVDGQSTYWVYDVASRSGVFQAQYGAPVDQTQLFAVNLGTRESNLEQFDPELLPSQLLRDVQADHNHLAAAAPDKRPQFFRSLLGLALILLLAETLLAWRFGAAST